MKTKIYILIALIFFSTNYSLFAQSGMTIQAGGTVTVNGNLTLTPAGFQCGNPFTDTRDGQTYNTVSIGLQCWFAQNLNIGTRLAGHSGQTNNSTIEKYCYNDNDANCTIYGGLYQWNEAMQYSTTPGVQGICPTGWHLPTDGEWTTLTTFLGGESIAGGKMKEAGLTHWLSPNTDATNSSGFTALGAGDRDNNGYFGDFNAFALFWSSTEYDVQSGVDRDLSYQNATAATFDNYKSLGFSIRCLKN